MKTIIIEDESRAVHKLKKLLQEINPNIEIIAALESVEDSIDFFQKNNIDIDVIFSDIQLSDGISFEIFEKISFQSPIIFITAFDKYAIKAFKTNGIDYLLKPIEKQELIRALDKIEKLKPKTSLEDLMLLAKSLQNQNPNYKERFMVKIGDKINSITSSEIVLFYSLQKSTFILTKSGKKYIVDYSLEQLENMLHPNRFYRISRKYIVSIDACKDIISHSNSRLKIRIEFLKDEDIIVSREKVSHFKNWLDN